MARLKNNSTRFFSFRGQCEPGIEADLLTGNTLQLSRPAWMPQTRLRMIGPSGNQS